MASVEEVLKQMEGKENEKGERIPNRFSKKNFKTLMQAMANDPTFVSKVAVVKEKKLDHLEDVMVSENFRKWCRKLLEAAGIDKKESALVMDPSFTFDNMDGLYEFFSTAVYEYMNAGNRFDFMPKEDFKGSITIKNNPASKKVKQSRNPRTGQSLGEYEHSYGTHKTLVSSSSCPEYLHGRKKV